MNFEELIEKEGIELIWPHEKGLLILITKKGNVFRLKTGMNMVRK